MGKGAGRFYPDRATRMYKSARVFLECRAVTDRPPACAVARESLPGFGFGAAAVRVAQASRLSGPAGVWPVEIVVVFRITPLAHPIVAYC
jgi:hypothetical protein